MNWAHFRVEAKTFLPVGWIEYSSSEANSQRQALLETVFFLCVYSFIVYFLAVLGPCCCMCFFCPCGERVLLCSCSAKALIAEASRCRAWALGHGLSGCGAGLSCSSTCGTFWHQGSNPCLVHWQADSLPLSHQGGLVFFFK